MSPSFGTLLRRYRMAAAFSQEALAEAAGVSTSAIGAYERGIHAAPHRQTVEMLADALALTGAERTAFEHSARRKPKAVRAEAPPIESTVVSAPATTSFVGRESDVAVLEEQLRRTRCVTVTGTGGIGKTRLALHVASRIKGDYRDGVTFVDLGSASDAGIVLSKVAFALGVSPPDKDVAVLDFSRSLRDRTVLLILDNCEHVLDAAATMASAIVRTAPNVTILATSRERLRISGEVVYRLPALAVPSMNISSAAEARCYSSVRLFTDRVAEIDPRFPMGDAAVQTVADICRRLEGIPLALELAAARAPLLGLTALRDQLRLRLSALSGGSRDLPTRQQTLDATLSWSYELLDEHTRAVLRRVGAFAGGWTLDAAQIVCADEHLSAEGVCDALASLVDKSIVVADHRADTVRYRLLHVMRMFAAAKASEAGEVAINERRHAEWMLALALLPSDALDPIELDNLRRAVESVLGSGNDVPAAAQILASFGNMWRMENFLNEYRGLAKAALQRLNESEHLFVAAKLHWQLSNAARGAEGIDAGERAVALFERLGDRFWTARAWSSLAWAIQMSGQLERASDALDRSAALYLEEGMGDGIRFAELLLMRGTLAIQLGDLDRAFQIYHEAMAMGFAHAGEGKFSVGCRVNLAELDFMRGNVDAALVAANVALEKARDLQLVALEIMLLANRAGYYVAKANFAAAAADAGAVLEQAWNGDVALTNTALRIVATVAAHTGNAATAARISGFVLAYTDRLGLVLDPTEKIGFEKLQSLLAGEIPNGAASGLQAEGARLGPDEALQLALGVTVSC